jgi:hypothetical protein
MRTSTCKISAAFLIASVAIARGGLQAQQAPTPKSADSPEMAQTETKLARLRELIRPQPGEYATNLAKIAWERDPWAAAVKAAKEGKPVLAYGVQSVGVTGGYG